VIKNHEFQTHLTISKGFQGHVKIGETLIGTLGA